MEENIQNKHHDQKNDYAWGAFLMFIGLMLLFNSLDILPWDSWGYIVRFWPVFIIIAGFSIIFDSSRYFRWVIGILALAVYSLLMILVLNRFDPEIWKSTGFEFPAWLSSIDERFVEPSLGNMIQKEFIISPQFEQYTNYKMDIDIDASSFSLEDDDDVERFEVFSKYFENWGKPIVLVKENDDILEIDFEQEKYSWPRFNFPNQSPSYDFLLGDNLFVVELTLTVGAGKGSIYLDTTDVERMNAEVGAGQLEVTIEEIVDESEYSFDIGAGEMILTIPDDVNYTLQYSLGIGNLSVNGEDISKVTGDGEYRFEDGESGKDFLIQVDVGVGSFELNTVNLNATNNVQW